MSLLLRRGLISSGRGGLSAANTADFKGTGYFNVADDPTLDAVDLGLNFWVKFNNLPASFASMASKYEGSVKSFHTYINSSGKVNLEISDDGMSNTFNLASSATLTTGIWYNIGYTYDGSTARIYIGGSQDTSSAYAGGIHSDSSDFVVGARNGANMLDGTMSNLNYATTTEYTSGDMTEFYNSGNAKCLGSLSSSITTKTVAAWDLSNTGVGGNELDDLVGSLDLTNNNSVTFDGTGLNVECT